MKNRTASPVKAKFLRTTFGALLLAISLPVPALAADVTVFVKTEFEPTRFEGLVTSTKGVVTEKVNPAHTEVFPNYHAVTFSIDDKLAEGQTATAVALDNHGRMAVGSVVPATSKMTSQTCAPEAVDPVTIEVDAGTIRSLAANRLKRREHNRKIFELSFAQFPSSEIERVERNFGLNYPDHVKRDINPFQMVDRISRLLVAFDSWNFRKSSTVPEQAGEEPPSSIPREGGEPSSNE